MPIAAVLLMASLVLAAAPHAARAQSPDAEAEAAILAGANALREREGLAALAPDASLNAAARDFAAYMAREGRYGHEADGRQPAERAGAAGYRFCRIAENIAWASGPGIGGRAGGERLVGGWSRSPGHRANLLEPAHTETGVGVARGGTRLYAVHLFGRPASARLAFEVRNGGATAVRYRLDATEWTLQPRATRRHERCDAGRVAVGGTMLPFADGARYVVERDARGAPTLRRDGP